MNHEHPQADQPDGFGTLAVDFELSLCTEAIARELFKAMQLQAAGAIDNWTIETMPAHHRQELRAKAQALVLSMNGAKRDLAISRARGHVQRWLESYAAIPISAAAVYGGDAEREERRRIASYIEALTSSLTPNIITETLAAYQDAILKPVSPRLLAFRQALFGGGR